LAPVKVATDLAILVLHHPVLTTPNAPGEYRGPGLLLGVLQLFGTPSATLSAHLPHDIKEHQNVISLCGTFPHRDHNYNRTTSVIGKSLMDNPVVRFDLPLCESEDGTVFFGHDPSKLWQATQRAFDVIDRFDALINHSARCASTLPAGYMTKQRSAEVAEIFKIFDKIRRRFPRD
jgi:hypothetical protein